MYDGIFVDIILKTLWKYTIIHNKSSKVVFLPLSLSAIDCGDHLANV
jgi:hypothetical protein